MIPGFVEDFDELVRTRGDALLRYGYVLAGNAEDAADLVQEALARLGDAWPRVRKKHDPEGYVRTTMARLHIRSWRRRRREDLVAEVPERGESDRYGDADLWAELQQLPRKQRAVLVLRYYEDLPDQDIADILGISRGTVRSQAARALDKLRIKRAAPVLREAR
ncbi:RNA polymerase sigma-70 factor, sigma-E family [Nonomuraea solani]|uniref:RNA polymerase sigma-70 factor, sigma-E family n=1 Tax=Nonomuraea solani TaxID=1144553 RepID=A0A1H6CVY7_9ACTN|nr:SigE family RNA polymerase sigma factor [Nonomuraea solani]SEG76685.1 RNA polymerase sigma-70 factor, sigma-E family [Nonomuraea solani]